MNKIIAVDEKNQIAWAKLCNKLWVENTHEIYINWRKNGLFKYEFLYERDGMAIAFLSLSVRHDYVEGTQSSPVGYIEGIYVENEFRKQGIARELIEFAKQWSKRKGCTELASACEIENINSRKFHSAAGFTEAGVIVHFTMKI